MSTKKSRMFSVPQSPPPEPRKVQNFGSITTKSPYPTPDKHTHLLITRKPPVTPRNCSYAATHGIWNFVTNQVFETSSQIIFVINWMSRCKQESLTFAVSWRNFLRMPFNFPFLMTMTEDNNLSFTEKNC